MMSRDKLKFLTVVLSIFSLVASVAYIAYRMASGPIGKNGRTITTAALYNQAGEQRTAKRRPFYILSMGPRLIFTLLPQMGR